MGQNGLVISQPESFKPFFDQKKSGMPNAVERLFRAVFLYTGLYWFLSGLWGIPQAWVTWNVLDSMGSRQGNELYCLIMIILIYGSKPIAGVIGICFCREYASRQYGEIPGISNMAEPKWHDTPVFATLLATLTGLYCMHYCFGGLTNLLEPLSFLGKGFGDITGIAAVDVWYYHWQPIFISAGCLICAIVLFAYTNRIVARVTQMIETTPSPKKDNADEQENATQEGAADEKLS